MKLQSVILVCAFLKCSAPIEISNKTFPADFKFGSATASYQVEGAWNEDGKGENVWDHQTHYNSSWIMNNDNGDVACDSYHKYKEDVQMLKDLGVYHYRFSVSWSRILPSGYNNSINAAGVQYYKNLVQELKSNNIEPMVTLYHYDLPQPIQDIGGFPNKAIIQHFVNYARVLFQELGPYVKHWFTFNEPKNTCLGGYGNAFKAPFFQSPGIADYLCAHNVLKAHAAVYHLYDEEFRAEQGGKVGIVADTFWYEPATNSTADKVAAERQLQFIHGWYIHPLILGNYPQVMIDRVANRSKLQGFSQSRLPVFTPEEIDYLNNTLDFLGLNHYTSSLVAAAPESDISEISWDSDVGVKLFVSDEWPSSAADWLKVVPWGARKILNWVKNTYKNPEIIITENGFSDTGGTNDTGRIAYYQQYLSNILEARLTDNVNVTAYTAWSLMDNFEWMYGYSQKFGLYEVDFSSPNRSRTAKESAKYYKKVIATRCLVDTCV